MRRAAIVLALSIGLTAAPEAASSTRIIKVLQHLEDRQGRHTPAPSLYERDAYQAYLRQHPEEVAALRFDIRWKARVADPKQLRLRIEVRGSKDPRTSIFEAPAIKPKWYDAYTSIRIRPQELAEIGEVVSWRATLWEGNRLLAEQRSFLW